MVDAKLFISRVTRIKVIIIKEKQFVASNNTRRLRHYE